MDLWTNYKVDEMFFDIDWLVDNNTIVISQIKHLFLYCPYDDDIKVSSEILENLMTINESNSVKYILG